MAKRLKKTSATGSTGPKPGKQDRPDRDRRVRQADRLARILRVLELIQSRGRWTTRAIAEEIQCSERTVYRDLDVLKFAGIPYFREGYQQFVRVRSDFRFPVMSLTEDEVLGLSLATVMSKAPGLDVTPGAGPTTRKLAAVSREETQELIDDAMRLVSVLDLKLADHSRHHEVIKTIQLALLRGCQISGQYESPYEPAAVKLKLHPYRLCLIKNAWYVIGRQTEDAAPKTFRVARFKALRAVAEPAVVPEDFDLRDYFGNAWAVYRGDRSYDVELWFPKASAPLVIETIWHHTQRVTRQKDGSVILRFQIDGLNEILHWLLSWAGRVRVQQPAELKELFVKALKDAISLQAAADQV
ncbi:helix-turn-helix transcriptional regulator [Planctellipticum variicoloris]|uniref:helix-turn-helix transcriptional regulator n=1 Tax=Planctellipticum variicoloris TaxID=3064265 RepID=UPI0030135211|nr:WYL domain-containing protein [Planctomycetaceae bacterium SH412]